MRRSTSATGVIGVLLLGAVAAVSGGSSLAVGEPAQAQSLAIPALAPQPAAPARIGPPPARLAPAVTDVLQSGVLIVISKSAQQMYVFKDGEPWASSPVSTGKRGHGTPAGVFPILQKNVHHRSNLYSNAPMPYMQRLTWGGIAIHAGHLPGYPASHGCIRVPYSFAKSLFSLTRADATTVVVTNEAVRSDAAAVTLALNTQAPLPVMPGVSQPTRTVFAAAPLPPQTASSQPTAPQFMGPAQTIQLAASTSAYEAETHWSGLVSLHPELGGFRKIVIPVIIRSRQYYRLRASAPGAHAYCASLKRSGQDCFNVS